MVKKLVCLGMVIAMLFALAACNKDSELEKYKEAAKAEIQEYADSKNEDNYAAENWSKVCSIVGTGKQAIDVAKNKGSVDAAVTTAKEEIRAVQTNNTFPSALESFNLEGFTDEFFEDNTLILVPFEWSYLLYENLEFYTAFAENGKLNFLIEVTDPLGKGDAALDMRLFAVIVPNAVFSGLDIGETRIFERYNFSGTNPTENSRDVLSEVEKKSVVHRVSLVSNGATIHSITETIVILSRERLQEYFNL